MNLKRLYFFLFLIVWASCTSNPKQTKVGLTVKDSAAAASIIDSIGHAALAFRKGNDITSNMLAQLNITDKRFSHIGICFVEEGKAMVYHSLGAEYGTNQFLRKDDAATFFNLENNMAIGFAKMNLSSSEIDTLHQLLQNWYAQKIPFDMSFNLQTDDSLYCSEMVAKALMTAIPKIHIPVTDTFNRSYYGVDNISSQPFVGQMHLYSRAKNAKQ